MNQFQRPSNIYASLSADEYISEHIGEIALALGDRAPALMVVPPYLDKDAAFTGTSISIHEDPSKFGADGDGGGTYRYFLISVVCHDEDYVSYRGIVNRIIQRYPYRVKPLTIQNSDTLGLPQKPRTDIYVFQHF